MLQRFRAFGPRSFSFAFLVALELLMSFTFLGYFHLPSLAISITFAYLPVLVAGCFMGVGEAVFLGALFGLASMFKASAYYVKPADQAFSPFFSGTPWQSLVLSVGTRALFGLLMGLLYWLARKSSRKRLFIALLSLLAPIIHAVLVYGCMGLLFPQLGYTAASTFTTLNANSLLLSLLCVAVIGGITHISRLKPVRDFWRYAGQTTEHYGGNRHVYRVWGVFALFTLAATMASSVYFANRITYMMSAHGMELSETVSSDLLHLQVQFLIAAFSLNFILTLSLIAVYKYLSYREYLSELDALTGVMGRKLFLRWCEDLQSQLSDQPSGIFIFIDVDNFKDFNDTYGHPVGDRVLQGVASRLQSAFQDCGKVGRLGGDEFAVLLPSALPREAVQARLDRFQSSLAGLFDARPVSCSIGVCCFRYPQTMQTIYAQTDKLLYQAKERGRACYVMAEFRDGALFPLN